MMGDDDSSSYAKFLINHKKQTAQENKTEDKATGKTTQKKESSCGRNDEWELSRLSSAIFFCRLEFLEQKKKKKKVKKKKRMWLVSG